MLNKINSDMTIKEAANALHSELLGGGTVSIRIAVDKEEQAHGASLGAGRPDGKAERDSKEDRPAPGSASLFQSSRLDKYQSHKQVKAAIIREIVRRPDGTVKLLVQNQLGSPFHYLVDDAYDKKHNPQPGGYLVVYKDGYNSFSPADAFTEGNKLVPGRFPQGLAPHHNTAHDGCKCFSCKDCRATKWICHDCCCPCIVTSYDDGQGKPTPPDECPFDSGMDCEWELTD